MPVTKYRSAAKNPDGEPGPDDEGEKTKDERQKQNGKSLAL